VEPEATVYTDEARAYEGMDGYAHKPVNHPVSEFVDGMAQVNDMENSRALFRPDITWTFRHISAKRLWRYVGEFVTRHRPRRRDMEDIMAETMTMMEGKRLTYRDLISD